MVSSRLLFMHADYLQSYTCSLPQVRVSCREGGLPRGRGGGFLRVQSYPSILLLVRVHCRGGGSLRGEERWVGSCECSLLLVRVHCREGGGGVLQLKGGGADLPVKAFFHSCECSRLMAFIFNLNSSISSYLTHLISSHSHPWQVVIDYVANNPQCSDIALNFLHASITDMPPLLIVDDDKRVTEAQASSVEDKTAAGSACLNDLETLLGDMPLRNTTQVREAGFRVWGWRFGALCVCQGAWCVQ